LPFDASGDRYEVRIFLELFDWFVLLKIFLWIGSLGQLLVKIVLLIYG
jgi:hypothetical protein